MRFCNYCLPRGILTTPWCAVVRRKRGGPARTVGKLRRPRGFAPFSRNRPRSGAGLPRSRRCFGPASPEERRRYPARLVPPSYGAKMIPLLLSDPGISGSESGIGIGMLWHGPATPLSNRAPASTKKTGARTARVLLVNVRRQRADEVEVAVLLGEVQAVADNEFVGDLVADVLDVYFDLGRCGLAQQRADLHRRRSA